VSVAAFWFRFSADAFFPMQLFDYVLRAELHEPSPTRVFMRRLTAEEIKQIELPSAQPLGKRLKEAMQIRARAKAQGRELNFDEALQLEKMGATAYFKALTQAYGRALSLGVVRITGLQDESGNPLHISPAEFLVRAPGLVLSELFDALMRTSDPQGYKRKAAC
jgi:hypothetical protein